MTSLCQAIRAASRFALQATLPAADVTNTQKANIDGSGLRQIKTPAGINPTSAQWSPDANWIAFSGSDPTSNASSEVHLIHPNGSGLREIALPTQGCSSFAPIWSPHGTKLLFETQCYRLHGHLDDARDREPRWDGPDQGG